MNQKLLDAFQMLDLSPDSSIEEARLAYGDLIQVWHPDKQHNNDRLRNKQIVLGALHEIAAIKNLCARHTSTV